MSFRLSPLWWPALVMSSPAVVPWLILKNHRFRNNCIRASQVNQKRIREAGPLTLPALDFLELTVLVEWKSRRGFLGDAGVSYVFKTNLGSVLFDVGFGPARPALTHNATQLRVTLDQVDALVISHLHGDHMGGIAAQRALQVKVPAELMAAKRKPCFLPGKADAKGFEVEVIDKPRLLSAGIASIGPLARSDFLLDYTEEQALLARVKGKGLVVFTGCGHPGIEVVLEMVRRLSDQPVYVLGGGLHFPVTGGRVNRAGIQFQAILGTGKPPWQRITDEDLSQAIATINDAGRPQKVYLSAHDTCDYALERLKRELNARSEVLEAGATYRL